MTADTTRQEVRFVRWDIPEKKQEDLPERVRKGEVCRLNAERTVMTALGAVAEDLWAKDISVPVIHTFKDGSDGEVGSYKHILYTDSEISVYNRKYLVSLLKNMDSDCV